MRDFMDGTYCIYETLDKPIQHFYCGRHQYCCGTSCCKSPAFDFWKIWYFWLLVLLMVFLCSGRGWWYRCRSCTHFLDRDSSMVPDVSRPRHRWRLRHGGITSQHSRPYRSHITGVANNHPLTHDEHGNAIFLAQDERLIVHSFKDPPPYYEDPPPPYDIQWANTAIITSLPFCPPSYTAVSVHGTPTDTTTVISNMPCETETMGEHNPSSPKNSEPINRCIDGENSAVANGQAMSIPSSDVPITGGLPGELNAERNESL